MIDLNLLLYFLGKLYATIWKACLETEAEIKLSAFSWRKQKQLCILKTIGIKLAKKKTQHVMSRLKKTNQQQSFVNCIYMMAKT